MSKLPQIGVGVIITRIDTVLLGKRKNSHGEGTWGFPGGHLEFGESIEECAKRETLEETGLVLQNLIHGPYTNDILQQENKHYVTLFVLTNIEEGVARVQEPDKCEEWRWFRWPLLPEPLFTPVKNLVEIGFSPFKWSYFK